MVEPSMNWLLAAYLWLVYQCSVKFSLPFSLPWCHPCDKISQVNYLGYFITWVTSNPDLSYTSSNKKLGRGLEVRLHQLHVTTKFHFLFSELFTDTYTYVVHLVAQTVVASCPLCVCAGGYSVRMRWTNCHVQTPARSVWVWCRMESVCIRTRNWRTSNVH